jgi:two-component system cell cycle sensor histidine kinase/response regulator CckA
MLQPRVINVNEVIGSAEKMLRRLISEDIELTTRLTAELWSVEVDPSQLEQVILNLAVNARDAMPEGGQLTIETANVILDEHYASQHTAVVPGRYTLLAVSDSGTGMDAATQARIFEPFFTTKEQGKGTGLGLSTVIGIVQQSGGHIWVYSEPGHGSTFKVYLPEAGRPAQSLPEAAPQVAPMGDETVLLVEDDPEVRQVARAILHRHGYDVIEAHDGGEAITLCQQHPASIALLLTDVVMPRMSGRQLAAQLRTIRPHLRVLFMSGYTDDAIVRHGVLEAGMDFLQKPLTPQALAAKVRQVLDAPSA